MKINFHDDISLEEFNNIKTIGFTRSTPNTTRWYLEKYIRGYYAIRKDTKQKVGIVEVCWELNNKITNWFVYSSTGKRLVMIKEKDVLERNYEY